MDNTGKSVNGQLVHVSTRQKHWAQRANESEEATIQAMFPELFVPLTSNQTAQSSSDEETSSDESNHSSQVSSQNIIGKLPHLNQPKAGLKTHVGCF